MIDSTVCRLCQDARRTPRKPAPALISEHGKAASNDNFDDFAPFIDLILAAFDTKSGTVTEPQTEEGKATKPTTIGEPLSRKVDPPEGRVVGV